ncbi:hypothetical protein ACLQ3C_16985 [Gordonia sp. DT30]|uniref:hypothetical protein n=1 Tax=Gordonia sp. DT30 TaxID=3416546 RepID=UPI003CF03162
MTEPGTPYPNPYPQQQYPLPQGVPPAGQPWGGVGYPGGYGMPGAYGAAPYVPAPKPPLRHVALTRTFAACTMLAWLLIMLFGFLTFATVTRIGAGDSTFSGWGHWTSQGEGLPLIGGAEAVIFPGVLLPLLILFPTLLSSILILCNVARRGFAVVNMVFGIIGAGVATAAVVDPSLVVATFDDRSSQYVDAHYTFSAGPSAILNVVLGVAVVLLAIGGIIWGGKAPVPVPAYTQPAYPEPVYPQPGYAQPGYPPPSV